MNQVILVDDEQQVREASRQTLELAGYQVLDFAAADPALQAIGDDWPGVVVSDVRMPGMDGLELMRACRALDADLPVILVTGHGDVSMAVGAMRDGAYDFIEKPYRADRLTDVVRRALDKRALVLENRALRSELAARPGLEARLIGRSDSAIQLRRRIAEIADTDVDVLLEGETGTGKELVARCLHDHGARRTRRFVAINCGALPESIIESELFGHEAGAFTGARARRIGKFEYADRGTLFLDEIESMPLALQVRLLRVLQERVIERLGSNESIPVDVRVVAATKADLRAAAARGEFREDLFYRLDVVEIPLPALRDRREDIPLLFAHFAMLAASRYGREEPALGAALAEELMSRPWPGNVRELQNAAERFVLAGRQQAPAAAGAPLGDQVSRFGRSLIEHELARHGGSVKATYLALGIPRKTLYEKMRKYGLSRRDFVDP